MQWIRVITGISFAAATLAGAQKTAAPEQAAKATAAPLAQRQTIPLYLSDRRMLVMLRIGGKAPIPVVFDTGSNGNLVDLGIADAYHLPNTGPSPSIDGSTGKPVAGYDTFLKGATLGGVTIADARATALAYDQPDEVGIFGPNSFPGKLVRMEGARRRLVIWPNTADHTPSCEPFSYLGEEGDELPAAIVEVGDQKIKAILDTGNDSSLILPLEYIAKLSLDGPPKQIGTTTSAAGTQPILSAHLNGTLKVGSFTLVNPEIRFMQGGRPNVGFPIVSMLTLVMDPTGHKDWVLPAGTTGNSCTVSSDDHR